MTAAKARSLLLEHLTPRYDEGEAKAIARIVLEDAFSGDDDEQFYKILERLVAGEPVQYVLGQADFFGLKFRVNPNVLIPRQETEELVAWILEHLKDSDLEHPALLDIGLGSGCIGVTLKKKLPRLQLFGLEKSKATLEVAIGNARLILGENADFSFTEGDILNYHSWANFPLFDVVASNPPYIPLVEQSIMPEHVTAHEPSLALFVDNEDPLLFYRVIADLALQKLRPGGALFFECNEFNASQVANLLREKGFVKTELRKDLAGAERMLRAMRPMD